MLPLSKVVQKSSQAVTRLTNSNPESAQRDRQATNCKKIEICMENREARQKHDYCSRHLATDFNIPITVAKEATQRCAMPLHSPCRRCYENLPISVDFENLVWFRGQSWCADFLYSILVICGSIASCHGKTSMTLQKNLILRILLHLTQNTIVESRLLSQIIK